MRKPDMVLKGIGSDGSPLGWCVLCSRQVIFHGDNGRCVGCGKHFKASKKFLQDVVTAKVDQLMWKLEKESEERNEKNN